MPVVWAVAVDSLKNKRILVPAALAINRFLPGAVTPLLMLGGLYLCLEGVEKLAHKWLHATVPGDAPQASERGKLADPNVDLPTLEAKNIKGAIRTDFILSAEIVVIALGAVADASFATQVAVLSGIGIENDRRRLRHRHARHPGRASRDRACGRARWRRLRHRWCGRGINAARSRRAGGHGPAAA